MYIIKATLFMFFLLNYVCLKEQNPVKAEICDAVQITSNLIMEEKVANISTTLLSPLSDSNTFIVKSNSNLPGVQYAKIDSETKVMVDLNQKTFTINVNGLQYTDKEMDGTLDSVIDLRTNTSLNGMDYLRQYTLLQIHILKVLGIYQKPKGQDE